jgi:thiol-disulfide isomerase/thioredoxin
MKRTGPVRSIKLLFASLLAALMLMAVAGPPNATADDRINFTGTTLSGAPFSGASLAGKPAVLWFWTPWCPFCNAEGPSVSAVAAANPKVTFVGVAARSDVGAMQDFVSKYNLNFTNLNDADGSIWRAFNVPWQPAYVFLRPNGSSDFVNNPTSAMSQQELTDRVVALTAR